MSTLEDEIRDTLRSEAASLREVRPLSLPPATAHPELRAASRVRRAGWLRTWQGPAVAVAVVLLVAAALVTLKSLGNEQAAPAASPSPTASPTLSASATPRYYVISAWDRGVNPQRWAIVVDDEQTRKTIGTLALAGGDTLSYAASGAGDDRTFVVTAAAGSMSKVGPVDGRPGTWYLLRIHPGAADPFQVTKLAIKSPDEPVNEIALSADGTELAALSATGKSHTLRIYSVATGRLQHSWSATSNLPSYEAPFADLSWVSDSTVGFAVTYTPRVREEVRTLNIGAAGIDLLADSRVVWSQYVPAATHGTPNAPHACDTPFLTGNGQAVVCGNSAYSPRDKRLSAVWLAYPLATPTRPRVIGSVLEPKGVSGFNGSIAVEWTNPSGTELIGAWNTSIAIPGGQNITNYNGFVGDGTVRPFAWIPGRTVAW